MSESDDPYAEDELPPVSAPKKKRGGGAAPLPPAAGDSDDVDLTLAFKPKNDLGNATRLMTRFGDDLMYVENIGWFAWDDARWDRDGGQVEAVKRGHEVSAAIIGEAKAVEDKYGAKDYAEFLDKLRGWSTQTGNMAKVRGMLEAAQPYLAQPVDALDSHPFLLAAPNGTIRLGVHCELGESRREDRLTRALGVPYNPRAQCPRFERFLERIMPDPDMRAFLQRIFGYCLTGSTRSQAFFIFWGDGNNGKSTLMNLARKVFGDCAINTPVSTFLEQRFEKGGDAASPDLARMPGARLITAAEPPENARLAEGKVKEMSGGREPITARNLNRGFFEFQLTGKIVISTNHQPTIRGIDRGIWRRVRLVPFSVVIPKEEVDETLEDKLLEEAEGILQWMLTGCEDWFAQGLNPPAAAIAAVEDYRAGQDPVGEFLAARCEVCPDSINPSTGASFDVRANRLYDSYKEWCKEEGLDPLGGRAFGTKLTGRGIKRRKSGGHIWYVGLHLNGDPV